MYLWISVLSKNVLQKSYETIGNITLREKLQSQYGNRWIDRVIGELGFL